MAILIVLLVSFNLKQTDIFDNSIRMGGCNVPINIGFKSSKKQINKQKHTENGNISQPKIKIVKKLKILHLNKGSKFLKNSNELINDLICREDPDIFSIAECNISFNFNKKEIGPAYDSYNIELKK